MRFSILLTAVLLFGLGTEAMAQWGLPTFYYPPTRSQRNRAYAQQRQNHYQNYYRQQRANAAIEQWARENPYQAQQELLRQHAFRMNYGFTD